MNQDRVQGVCFLIRTSTHRSLFLRQRRLLALVDAVGSPVRSLDFQKLLFLYTKQEEDEPSYEFVPYRFGGFSFTSYADKRKLIERGLLEHDETSWALTNEGRLQARVPGAEHARMHAFAHRYAGLRGDALVAYVYRQFPYFASRSEIAHRVLKGDEEAIHAIALERPVVRPAGILTIGYEGHSLESYVNQLLGTGVTLLCDVRRNPLSRKYGFSKGTLSYACEGVGIRYEHLPELGIESARRVNLDSQAAYDSLFDQYAREDLPLQESTLRMIRQWICVDGYRVALTCFEHLPRQCHRRCVAEAVETMMGNGIRTVHL